VNLPVLKHPSLIILDTQEALEDIVAKKVLQKSFQKNDGQWLQAYFYRVGTWYTWGFGCLHSAKYSIYIL
jgi:hypothetical protein